MPLIQKSITLAALVTNANVLAGEFFEFPPYNALVEVGLCQSATGLLVDFITGTDVVAKDHVPLIKATSPVYPDDFQLSDVAAFGERLVLAVRNPTAGSLTLLYTIRITPYL